MEEEQKFVCKKCGTCCRLSETKEQGGLAIDEWDIKRLLKLAKEKGKVLDINPVYGIYDSISKKRLVIQYGLYENGKNCPFLENNKCLIYNERPLFCRAFPVALESPFGRDDVPNLITYSACPNVSDIIKKRNKVSDIEMYKRFFSVYEDIFLQALEFHFGGNIVLEIFKKLSERGLINAVPPFKQKEDVGLLAFALEKKVITQKEIDKKVKSIENLEYAKKIMKEVYRE